MDEAEIARIRRTGRAGPDDGLDRGGSPWVVGRVTTPGPTAAPNFVRVAVGSPWGAETEGGEVSIAGPTTTLTVLFLGPETTSAGDLLRCTFVDNRWVAEKGRPQTTPPRGVMLPYCFCTVPATLSMVSGDPSCNYGMFQSCTLAYGPPPPAMQAFGYTTDVYTSTESFTDPITGCDFFYYFACQYNQFFLTRIFPTSPFGSPYRDGYLYNWIVGGYGNTCDPFQLEIGTAFPGSDASCSVAVFAGSGS